MKLRGKIDNVSLAQRLVSFSVKFIPPECESIREEDLDITVEKHREKRSMTANAYYWVLIDRMSDFLGLTKTVTHNMMLRDYGQKEIIDGDVLSIMLNDTEETEKEVLRKTHPHLMPTSFVKDGKRAYIVLKGSSEMDSREFAALLDGVISEAKQMGLETLSDAEIERMMKAYEEHHTN